MSTDYPLNLHEFYRNFFTGEVDEELIDKFVSISRVVTKEKGEIIFGPEATGPSSTFLLDGIMKTFVLSPDGEENTYALFFRPGTAICLTKEMINASGIYLKTLTKTTYVEMVGIGPWDLVEEYPILYREVLYAVMPLTFGMLDKLRAGYTLSAKERYLWFLNKYAPIVDRISLAEVSLFLGIKPQSLSRIRAELAEEEGTTPPRKFS